MSRERPISEVLQDILRSLQEIVRAEVRLAKAELKVDVTAMARSAAWIGAGVIAGLLSVALFAWSAVYALSYLMAMWAATLVVGIALAGVGCGLVTAGLRRAKRVRPVPERTIETVKENFKWMKPSLE
jgi:hypothetical protein